MRKSRDLPSQQKSQASTALSQHVYSTRAFYRLVNSLNHRMKLYLHGNMTLKEEYLIRDITQADYRSRDGLHLLKPEPHHHLMRGFWTLSRTQASES